MSSGAQTKAAVYGAILVIGGVVLCYGFTNVQTGGGHGWAIVVGSLLVNTMLFALSRLGEDVPRHEDRSQ